MPNSVRLRTWDNAPICSVTIGDDENVATVFKMLKALPELSKFNVRFVAHGSFLPLDQNDEEDFVKHVHRKMKVAEIRTTDFDSWPARVDISQPSLPFPLDFVIVHGPESGRVLHMATASTTSTVHEMVR